MITATNEDNMILMARYPDDYFELSIVDPPYGINWTKQIKNPNLKANWLKHSKKDWDNEAPDVEYFNELFRVSKNQVIWGANHFINKMPINSPCWIIWDKMQEFSSATFEMAWTSFNSPAKAFRMSRAEAYTNQNKIHPTQKPIKLYEWILMNYAKEGDKIVDTHRGSASLDIACHNLGFDLVTCELDTDYFNDGNKRLKQHQQQLTMF
jgi:site-specific DNA-methyltransferase (adenine-specific)